MSSSTATHLDDEIIYELPDTIKVYQSGRVERLVPDDIVPPSLDPDTGVESKDVIINPSTGLSVRLYLPPSTAATSKKKLPVLVYYHGGSFCILRAFSSLYHNFLNTLTAKADVLTVSVDYRLAPENPLPAAYEDSWEALNWVFSHSGAGNPDAEPWLSDFADLGKIFLAGDSAGGNIVKYLGLKLGGEGLKVEGIVPVHSYIWGKDRIGSEGAEWKKSKRSVKDAEGLWPIVCPGTVGLDDPWINPLADGAPDIAGLGCRRVLVCAAERDLLRERGRAYYEKLKESGWEGEVEFMESEEEDHVFFLFKPQSSKTVEFIDRLANFFNKAKEEQLCAPISLYAIVSMQRSGSKWFEALLDSHDDIRSRGEIFRDVDRRCNMTVIRKVLDKVFGRSRKNCFPVVGFKWMLNQGVLENHEEIVDYFNRRGVSVILLFRRNHLRRLVSLKANNHDGIAKDVNGTHRAHVFSKDEAEILGKYKPKLSIKGLIPTLEQMECLVTDTLNNFGSTRHMVVYYEDLVRNQTEKMNEVLEFLMVPKRKLISDHVKIHTKPLAQQIGNWRDVVKSIKRTKYRGLITDND